jgi:hypothetical protein
MYLALHEVSANREALLLNLAKLFFAAALRRLFI